jgi:hypothetical protein
MPGAKVFVLDAVLEHVVGEAVSMEAATAMIAFLAPRRARKRWNCACR